MKNLIRGNRKKVVGQSKQHLEYLFDTFKINHQALNQEGLHTPEMIQACNFYGIAPTDNTSIFYTIIGIYGRLELLTIIKSRTTFKRFKKHYQKILNHLNPDFPHWNIFDTCCDTPVTYQNNILTRSLLNGLIPNIELSCGECSNPLYKKHFNLAHFKAKIGIDKVPIDLMFHELVQYLTGAILPFKHAISLTLKSSWINQEYFRNSTGVLYLVQLSKDTNQIHGYSGDHIKENFYKIGITRSFLNRMRTIPYESKAVVAQKLSLMDVVWIEHRLHKYNKIFSYPPKLEFAGSQECYSKVSKQSFKNEGLI